MITPLEMMSDFKYILQWWSVFFILGISFLPITTLLFSRFFDRGYIFSKTISVSLTSYVVFVCGILHLLSFTQQNILLIFSFFIILNICIVIFCIGKNFLQVLKSTWHIFLLEELLFFITLLIWSFVRAHQPDIHGLEKYMDFGFINSIYRSDYFPSKDMWFTPFSINYYYFGHLITAFLSKLSHIPTYISYNLMVATIFSLTFTLIFSLAINLLHHNYQYIKDSQKSILRFLRFICGGILSALIVSIGGNLQTLYLFFKPYDNEHPVPFWQLVFSPDTFPNSYWYPNATRFIYHTIHEFPLYSFVVSDLHGHVFDIPIVLTILALLLHILLNSSKKVDILQLVLLSLLLSISYMTNAWDGIIYTIFSLCVFIIVYAKKDTNNFLTIVKQIGSTCYFSQVVKPLVILFICFFIFSLPFSLHFKPFVSGFGILCVPDFLTSTVQIGPVLFEPHHCQKSPIWQLFILHGFFYIWSLLFLWYLLKKKSSTVSDIFIFLCIGISTVLIITPEFMYAKDIYPDHYRANTMFKLVYQAFIMLSIVVGYSIVTLLSSLRLIFYKTNVIVRFGLCCLLCSGVLGLFLVLLYPRFAISSYYGDLETYYGLDGTVYLQKLYPSDYQAIRWMNDHIAGQPIILEAQGDSYTDYARVSANTGLPTVLGWTVHEWLWRGSYDIPAPRIEEVKTLYETRDETIAKELINKYHIKLIFIGNLEREKYPNLNESKFQKFGKLMFQIGTTKIYKIY